LAQSVQLHALDHTVRLMPPSYVKAYLKRSKNDANDAAAICEAVTRPSMRFVPSQFGHGYAGGRWKLSPTEPETLFLPRPRLN
jgi:hypothetical protein